MSDFLDAQNELMVDINYEKPSHKRFPDYLDLKRRGFSEEVQKLLQPFETGVEKSLHKQIQNCEKVLNVIREDPEKAKDLSLALGFDRLVKSDKFKANPGEERILGRFGNLVEGGNGSRYPTPLATVIGVISNGLPKKDAEIVMDEIARSKRTERTPDFPKNETALQWAFRLGGLNLLFDLAHAPKWVGEKYTRM